MTKDELIEALKTVSESMDAEEGHIEADRLLLQYINDDDIKDAYGNVPKWYS